MKQIIFGIALFSIIVLPNTASAQLTFTTDHFSKVQTNINDLDITQINDLGFTIPIDEKITKYDKIVVFIYFKNLDEDTENYTMASGYNEVYYPKKESFKDNYSSKLKLYLITDGSDHSADARQLISNEYFESSVPRAYIVTVDGYFLDGTETVWNEYKESFETKDIYVASKEVYRSPKITFIADQKSVDRVKNMELVRERYRAYNELHEEIVEYVTPIHRLISGRCYYPIKKDIEAQAKQGLKDLDVDSINEVIELESKYMEIFKDKKRTKELLKEIDKMTDFEERKKAVLEF